MTRRPVVVDTNVVVAGLLTSDPGSPPARILDGMLDGSLLYLLSEPLLAEYREVLLRPKIAALHGLDGEAVDQLLVDLTLDAIVRPPKSVEDTGGGDPGDRHLWELLATEARALLVTGDERLRRRAPSWAEAVSPRDFVSRSGHLDVDLDSGHGDDDQP